MRESYVGGLVNPWASTDILSNKPKELTNPNIKDSPQDSYQLSRIPLHGTFILGVRMKGNEE
jgi:hypothetical protein